MPGVFINYRRQDAQHAAARLADDLAAALGKDRVMLDVGEIGAGDSFADSLDNAVASCEVMLVLIGPHWIKASDNSGRPRLHDPDDFVRHEIELGLQRSRAVIPVLVSDAEFPLSEQLPASLQPLLRRNGFVLSDGNWRGDVTRLVQQLRPMLGADPSPSGTRGLLGGLKGLFGSREAADALPAPPAPPAASSRTARQATAAPVAAPPAVARAPAAGGVFVSYAFEDESWAQSVVATLESAGHACFIASRDIVPGSPSYARDVVRAIKGSRLMVVLLSAASNASEDVLGEITVAKNNKVPRLALRIDEAPLDDGFEYFFAQSQRLEVAGLDAGQALARLAAAVRRQLAAS